MACRITLILALAVLQGCGHLTIEDVTAKKTLVHSPGIIVAPDETHDLLVAKAFAEECSEPAPAIHEANSGFKYGCFCGKNWPDLRHGDIAKMTPAERHELVKVYYSIKPIDDIDAACQAHDVCWVINGRPERACNFELENSMLYIRDHPKTRITGQSPDAGHRCSTLAMDVAFAGTVLMEGASDDPVAETLTGIGRGAALPATATYYFMYRLEKPFIKYPSPEERCFVSKNPKDYYLR